MDTHKNLLGLSIQKAAEFIRRIEVEFSEVDFPELWQTKLQDLKKLIGSVE